MRILHVVRPAAGGIRQHVIELIRRTDAARFSLSLAGPAEFLSGLPSALPLQQTTALDIAAGFSPFRDLRAAWSLSRLVPCPQGLVHAHGLRAAFVTALAHCRRPFPFVFTAHNLISGGRLTRLGIQFAGRRASCIIAISQSVADGLVSSGISERKISIIPNGVDVAHFGQTSILAEPEGSGFVVGCVARLSPEKGVDVLLKAAALNPEMTVLIAGDGPEREALHRLAPPNVRWLGRVADTREVYSAVDVVAIPSRQEGQGIVALEAMAAGVPVVASRVGGLAEMQGELPGAILVPPDDPAALAASLTYLQHHAEDRAELSAVGRALVREKYDVRRMVERVEQVYAQISPDQ